MTQIILTEEASISFALNELWIDAIKNELQKNVDFSKALAITDFEDKKQFELVKSTKNWYVKTRNTIKRAFKFKRDEYNALAKQNLERDLKIIEIMHLGFLIDVHRKNIHLSQKMS